MAILDSFLARRVLMFLGPRLMPRSYFEVLYKGKRDPWACETSPYETLKYERTAAAVDEAWTENVLELGCGEGVFSRMIAPRSKRILATDMSESAVARGREHVAAHPELSHVEFRTLDVTREPLPSGFSLVVAAEMLYFVGRGRKYDRVCKKILGSMKPGGHLLTVNRADYAPRIIAPFTKNGARIVSEELHPDPARAYVISVLQK